MSDHQKHTEFLKHCLLYDDSSERREVAEKLARVQRDLRCVRRAAWLMALLAALAVAGLGYAVLLVDNFPYNMPPFILDGICTMGVGSLISLLAFAGLGMIYCRRLDQRREECRQLVAKVLASRLGQPATADGTGAGLAVRIVSADRGSPTKIESAAEG